MERNVEVVTESDKEKIVRIHDIRFKGKRSINWRQVREYLKDYVGAAFCEWEKYLYDIRDKKRNEQLSRLIMSLPDTKLISL